MAVGAAPPVTLGRRGGVEGLALASGRVICAAGRPVAAPEPRYVRGSALELACEVLIKTRRSSARRRVHRTSIDLPPAPRAARTRRALP